MNSYFDFIEDGLYKDPNKMNNMYPSDMIPNFPKPNMENNCGLYNPKEGFEKGNMFPNAYKPYKNEKSSPIMVSGAREKELLEIQQLGFAMTDINLYLDVNPNDSCMINLYSDLQKKKENELKNFEMQYGPITLMSETLSSVPWAWDITMWPWEGGK